MAIVNKKKVDAIRIAEAMKEGFKTAGFEAIAFVTKPGKGVCLVEK
jgi:galactokinase